jgi:SAM-dependent methyltransferase
LTKPTVAAMDRSRGRGHVRLVKTDIAAEDAARAYNQAAEAYLAYADGDPKHLFTFAGHHAYADRHVWSVLDTKLRELRSSGATSITILDAGCGPGTWLRRLVTRGRSLGFSNITARGFDVAQAQIRAARRNSADLQGLQGLNLTFDVADIKGRLPEADESVDITLCLYSVLSHLPITSLPQVTEEIARVTRGQLITTVRSIGSTPTVFIDSIETARRFELDHELDRCEIEFFDGRRMALHFHLFTADELRRCFANQFNIEDLCGLDIFHGRFSPDHRWNPSSCGFDPRFSNLLAQLEEKFSRNPSFMERATHLMLVGRRRTVI